MGGGIKYTCQLSEGWWGVGGSENDIKIALLLKCLRIHGKNYSKHANKQGFILKYLETLSNMLHLFSLLLFHMAKTNKQTGQENPHTQRKAHYNK